ncbi:MAG: sigma-54 interaction domain-containing protein [Candidatus Binatia bacterium]
MESLLSFQLAVWREVSRHTEINDFATALAGILSHRLPIARLAVVRIDHNRCRVETIALTSTTGNEDIRPAAIAWPEHDMARLQRWIHRGEMQRYGGDSRRKHVTFAVIPPTLQGQGLIGPLVSERRTYGLLLMQFSTARPLTAEQEQLCAALLEPCAVALDNDHRLQELQTLREAAEADKRFLLTRLGREEFTVPIIGAERGLRSVMDRVSVVARSDVPVLLLGETGSGKEVIARAIHERSSRARGPFLRVNCGAIPSELIDTELFGHEKGSFTGATATRRGWFERAHEGTLFLDEIGELPLAAQVRLLRVLQDGSFERIGGEHSITVDVRVIAATHRDLALMVQQGTFREDLWYRVAVFPIVLPPLRERHEDIPLLAEHFARRAAVRFGLKLQLPTVEDGVLLTSYSWPGNVRELGAVIDRAALLGDGERLEVARALGVGASLSGVSKPTTTSHLSELAATPALLSLDEVVRAHLEKALTATHGRIEGPRGAAAMLKINPHTLRARMRKLHVDWSRFRPGNM